ncbi:MULTISPECIES: DASS family sodium-coupled anion symporter [unclassified Thioalkalivibrio]|uniref:SLC13 family permease n=1 Tax=unclassified Thioalkalivibrio TaxID=2621013 RepID=UPI000382E45D|nr:MULTISPECIES: SLC13 family permease [unclassified Thioalkalivibrio]
MPPHDTDRQTTAETPEADRSPPRSAYGWRGRVGLVLGPLVMLAFLLAPPPEGIGSEAWWVLGLTLFMAIWWITEALPLPVTALLPIALLPLLGVMPMDEATAPYANPIIFLFMGGFAIALAVQRWGLHQRIALSIVGRAGDRLHLLVGAFMLATAGLSMWVSNTATAALMLPIALSVLALVERDTQIAGNGAGSGSRRPALALLLGIAFAANIGGMATIIGSPPNALTAAYLGDRHGIEIGFVQWMMLGLPLAIGLLLLAWWLLTRWVFQVHRVRLEGLRAMMDERRAEIGAWSRAEYRVASVFLLVALAWLSRPFLEDVLPIHLTDAGIAILGAGLLFLLPSGAQEQRRLLAWDNTRELPWGVLLLVGGGLSLGSAIEASGLAELAAEGFGAAQTWPLLLIIAGAVVVTMLLSHVTSNTATAATLLPLVAALAMRMEVPVVLLALPVAFAASVAFMLPVATPPNAIVFASNRLRVVDMVRGGALLSLVAIAMVTLAVYAFAEMMLMGQ